MGEVFERLKFLSKECFRTQEKEQYLFVMVLNEIDLYLQSYDQENEDSDWDSDEEVGVVQIAKDLKEAVDEKYSLVSQLGEVERNLLTNHSNINSDKFNSILSSSAENFTGGTLSLNIEPSQTPLSAISPTKMSEKEEDSSLYKNVLKKNKEQGKRLSERYTQNSIKIPNFFNGDSTNWNDEEGVSTPRESVQKALYESRLNQRVNSINWIAQRSSSIQSIRFNKASSNKKVKKKTKTGLKLKESKLHPKVQTHLNLEDPLSKTLQTHQL